VNASPSPDPAAEEPPIQPLRPLVLVHGLWDTPKLFDRLEALWRQRRPDGQLLSANLPHGLGQVPIRELAAQLEEQITARFGTEMPIDLLGFSMGGVVARTWLQERQGYQRTRRFISVGSPQQGTLAAQPVPQALFPGIADMKVGSPLLRDLGRQGHRLANLSCHSFYTPTDLTVVPGWRAVLPYGTRQALPVFSHRQLIRDPRALEPLVALLLHP
jgi:triacylglycerol lipase